MYLIMYLIIIYKIILCVVLKVFICIPGGKIGLGLYRKKLIYDVINIVIMSIFYFFNIYY